TFVIESIYTTYTLFSIVRLLPIYLSLNSFCPRTFASLTNSSYPKFQQLLFNIPKVSFRVSKVSQH
ncbi:MAG: hypothetical protein SPG69_02020, partial [Bacteroides pyogenes]|uniref:hypothetical protein n=1 Tax=Bacteroides pyogenes TaxID=310300 RepID=UPI002A911384